MKMEKILVPVDFSSSSRAALDLALAMAEMFHAKVHALHVLEMPLYSTPDLTVSVRGLPAQSYVSYAQRRATEEMNEFLADHRRADFTHAIVTGEPSSKILEAVEQGPYDLVVMGTRGRGGLKHLLLGSTAEWIVRHAACPVLTTHADHKPKGGAR